MGLLAKATAKAARNVETVFWANVASLSGLGLPRNCPDMAKLHREAWRLALLQIFRRSGNTPLGDLEHDLQRRLFDELSERCGLTVDDWNQHAISVKTAEAEQWFADLQPRWEAIRALPRSEALAVAQDIRDRLAFARIPAGIHPGLDKLRGELAERFGF